MKFEIHEICEANKWDGTWHECEIIGFLEIGVYIINVFSERGTGPGGYWREEENFLRKKKPPKGVYDGNEVVSWDKCIWRPETVNIGG